MDSNWAQGRRYRLVLRGGPGWNPAGHDGSLARPGPWTRDRGGRYLAADPGVITCIRALSAALYRPHEHSVSRAPRSARSASIWTMSTTRAASDLGEMSPKPTVENTVTVK